MEVNTTSQLESGPIWSSTPIKKTKTASIPSALVDHDYACQKHHFRDHPSSGEECHDIPLSPIEDSMAPILEESEQPSKGPSNEALQEVSQVTEPTTTIGMETSDETFQISESEEEEDEDLSDQELLTEREFQPLYFGCSDHATEEKFIVFECSFRKLLALIPCQARKNCKASIVAYKKLYIGSMISFHVKCENGHESKLWETQPKQGMQPLGNLLISAAVLLSGSSFLKMMSFFRILNLKAIGKSTFFKNQTRYLFPAIEYTWKKEQSIVLSEISNRPVCLIGDGQMDSPGFSAKYCVYSLMDHDSKKIVAFSVEQLVPTVSSVGLEKIAFEKTLQFLLQSGINIEIIATDRHVSIRKLMREKYGSIMHQFDVWHMAKSIGNKLLNASKTKNGAILSHWIQPIKNHVWWCSRTCNDDPDQLVQKWKSVIHHVQNVHEWETEEPYQACLHPPLTPEKLQDTKWLHPLSPALDDLKDIVLNKNFLKDLRQISKFCHTGELEIYHSVCLKYRQKRIHYFIDGMVARSQLAALDHNRNVNRVHAVVKQATMSGAPVGTRRHRIEFSKARKTWVVKAIYEPTTNEFSNEILSDERTLY
ncbi:uncharacterized protein [Engystomops pustulosus]|uniref:uncharacterized protein n=1 Tax=Engystomops pustulosus TaxID=76066 RepID=UPI003AFAF56E